MNSSSKSPKQEPNKDIAPKIEIPKYPDKYLKNLIDKPKCNPNSKPRNKIENKKLPPNYTPKNKIELSKLPSNYTPKNKIQRRTLPPNYKPKNKIRSLNFPPNDIIKNKISGIGIKDKNLMDPKIQNTFTEYHNEMGKYPNYGRNLKKDFIKWVEKIEKNPEISEKIKEIQNNQEISKFIKDKIQNLKLSQNEISKKLNETGLSISRKTIGNYALNQVFKGNKVEYNKRFDKSLEPKIKGRIINRINVEVEKYAAGVQHDSLYKIAKKFPEVSKPMIDKIAKNEISQDIYAKMWPSTSGTVDLETKQNVRNVIEREVQEGNPRSLRNISEDFPNVSTTTISVLAKEMYPEKYKEFWSAIEKISEETKIRIINTIQNEAQK